MVTWLPEWKETDEFSIQYYVGPENRPLRIETAMRGSIPKRRGKERGQGKSCPKWTGGVGWVPELPEGSEYLRWRNKEEVCSRRC